MWPVDDEELRAKLAKVEAPATGRLQGRLSGPEGDREPVEAGAPPAGAGTGLHIAATATRAGLVGSDSPFDG